MYQSISTALTICKFESQTGGLLVLDRQASFRTFLSLPSLKFLN